VSAPAPPRFSCLPSALILSTLVLVGRRRSPPCYPTPASTPRRVTRCRRLRHESCCTAAHVPVIPRHAFPDRLPCAGEVTAVAQAVGRACCAGRGRAGPGRGPRVLRWPRPSWARLGRARVMQAGCAALCNWAERGFGPMAVELVFHFPNIFKFLQI
jgi:hypothetical protein